MIKRLHAESGVTFVLISHQVASIADLVHEYHFLTGANISFHVIWKD